MVKAFKESPPSVLVVALLVSLAGGSVGAENLKLFDLDALDCVIDPSQVSDLGSGVPGLLHQVKVDRSDFVTAGQVVAELDSGVESAAVELAKARAELTAEVDLRRVNASFGKRQEARNDDLFRKKVISENDMDQRQTETRVAQLQLLQALDNKRLAAMELTRAEQVLQRRTIRTPISGVVMERFKSAGEYVDDQPVLRVAQLDPLYVEVILPVEVLGQVESGMQAEVWSEAVGDQVWLAEVSRVDRVADAASGTYGVRLALPNPDYQIPAGLRCQTRFVKSTAPRLSDAEDPTSPKVPTGVGSKTKEAVVAADQVPPHPPAIASEAKVKQPRNDHAQPKDFAILAESDNVPVASLQPRHADQAPDDFRILIEPDNTPVHTPPLCQKVGPIAKRTEAEKLFEQLSALGLDVAVAKQQAESLHGYQVVSASQPSFSKAKSLFTRLRTAGVEDTAIMREQGVRWVVSLGLYRHKRYAQARIDQLAAKGFETKLKPWKKTESNYVLAVSGTLDEQVAELIAPLPHSPAEPVESCEQLASR